LTERSTAQEEKRRLILDAAVQVFARHGYHASRVGDIAEEAGVAHGLLYHYFRSKEEVLATIFRENWSTLVARFRDVAASEEPAEDKLRGIAKILLRSWVRDPALVTVMIREVARSPHLQSQVAEIGDGFAVIQGVIEQGRSDGSFRPEIDSLFATWIFYGGLEELLTGWVLEQLPHGEADVARAEEMVVEIVCGGLCRR
jgi:AcrR family transcriptional regulator